MATTRDLRATPGDTSIVRGCGNDGSKCVCKVATEYALKVAKASEIVEAA